MNRGLILNYTNKMYYTLLTHFIYSPAICANVQKHTTEDHHKHSRIKTSATENISVCVSEYGGRNQFRTSTLTQAVLVKNSRKCEMAVRLIHSFTESPTNPQRSYNDQTLQPARNRLVTFTQTKEKNNKYNNEYCRVRVQTQHLCTVYSPTAFGWLES